MGQIDSTYYLEVENHAQSIWESIKNQTHPFTEVLSEFTGGKEEIHFTSYDDVRQCIGQFTDFAYGKCAKVNPEYALPILLQMYTNFYSTWSSQPYWLGLGIKHTVAIIWNNVLEEAGSLREKDLNALKTAVLAVQILHSLEATLYMEFFISVPFSFDGVGFQGSDKFHEALAEYHQSFKDGYLQRTWEQYAQVFMEDIPGALKAVERILNGESPRNQKIFEDTIFSKIGKSEPIQFWTGIWARINLIKLSLNVRRKHTENALGIAVFPDLIPMISHLQIDSNKLQQAVMELFWTTEWYNAKLDQVNLYEMLVNRPVMRIRNVDVLYVTSFFLLLDSLGNYIENSIMGYEGPSIKLSERFRKKFISDQFENVIVEKLQSMGFTSGRVETNGVWYTGEAEIKFSVKGKGRALFGEIDVLAYHPSKDLLVILECKVYELPSSPNQMRNLLNKFGQGDRKKINKRLGEKLEWVLQTDYFKGKKLSILKGLVLDRKFPGMFHEDFIVMDVKLFDRVINDLLHEQQLVTVIE